MQICQRIDEEQSAAKKPASFEVAVRQSASVAMSVLVPAVFNPPVRKPAAFAPLVTKSLKLELKLVKTDVSIPIA